MKWSKNGEIKDVPAEVKEENTPVENMSVKEPEPTDYVVPDHTKFIMIDCSSSHEELDDPNNPEGTRHTVDEVQLSWETATGFLSFAISEVKDYLFRLHKGGTNGTVHFIVTAYHPLDPLAMAFCALIGAPIQDYWFDFSDFIGKVEKESWFNNFYGEWLSRYSWTPELDECAIFEGIEYGGSERTKYSIAKERIEKINMALKIIEESLQEETLTRKIEYPDERMIVWKKLGGATTDADYDGKGFRPVYHFYFPDKYKWDHEGTGIEKWAWGTPSEQPLVFLTYSMHDVHVLHGARLKLCSSILRDNPDLKISIDMIREIPHDKAKEIAKDLEYEELFGLEEEEDTGGDVVERAVKAAENAKNRVIKINAKPVNEGIGDFYTYRQLKDEREELMEVEENDPNGPRWWIKKGYNPSDHINAGAATPNSDKIDSEKWAQMMAEEKKQQLEAWEKNTYLPQKKEYDEKLKMLEGRQNENSTEYEIWERRHVEDEYISDQWNYEENKIEYHGKLVDYDYLNKQSDDLENQHTMMLKQIEQLEDYVSLVKWVKFISAIQVALGFVSFGATTVQAIKALLVLDSLLEVGKMGFELYYSEDYKLGQALQDHMFSFINNLVSGLLLHSSFAKFTDADINAINKFEPKPKTLKDNFTRADEFVGKQLGDFNMWLDNLQFATKGDKLASEATKAITKNVGLVDKVVLRTEGFFYHNLLKWDKFHLAAGGAKAATFLYMANSMYENSLLVTTKQDMPLNEMIKLELIPPME